jgi:hypothetical protein
MVTLIFFYNRFPPHNIDFNVSEFGISCRDMESSLDNTFPGAKVSSNTSSYAEKCIREFPRTDPAFRLSDFEKNVLDMTLAMNAGIDY